MFFFVFWIARQLSGLKIISKAGTHSGMQNFIIETQVFVLSCQNLLIKSPNLDSISVGYLAVKNRWTKNANIKKDTRK